MHFEDGLGTAELLLDSLLELIHQNTSIVVLSMRIRDWSMWNLLA